MTDRPHRPLYYQGRLRISPSTLTLLDPEKGGCLRKFAFRKIAKIRPERGRGQRDGDLAHRELEAYYETGQPPRQDTYHGRLAAALVPHLPKPGAPDVASEEYLLVDTGSPLWIYHGYIDGREGPHVWDAKFYAASSRKWMATETTLAKDPQAIVYTAGQGPGRSFTMHYVIKPKDPDGVPQHEPVRYTPTEDEIDEALERLDRLALRAVWLLWKQPEPNSVPHDALTACEGIGVRCDYAGVCELHRPGELELPWTK